MNHDENPAYNTLWHPFQTGVIAWRERYLFLRGRANALPKEVRAEQIDCMQSFKPFADNLQRAGFPLIECIQQTYPIIFIVPPPQRDETRALFARALQNLTDDGLLVVCIQNDAGAKSGEKDLRQLAADVQSLSKNKCRVFWAGKKNINEALLQSWLKLDEIRRVEKTGFISRPGIFAWDRIDEASKLLCTYLPNDFSGTGADLGAGFGYLTHHVLTHCKNIKAMDVFEAEARALECSKLNLASFNANVVIHYHWHDVAQGIPGSFDFVISNPPFHEGHTEVQALGQAFIGAAAKSLKPNGRFYMVANRHLPYVASLRTQFAQVNLLAMQDGFKVFEAKK